MLDWYCNSSSFTITLGSEFWLNWLQLLELESVVQTPKSVPIYTVSSVLPLSISIQLTGTFGSEYDILEDILKVQNKISALIIEFHDINKYRTVIENFIQRLELDLTHIHPNNYGKLDKTNDPIIIELSFEKNPKIIGGEVKLPNKLDQKNNPKKNDIFIKFNDA